MIKFCSLISGSSGNCTFISSGDTNLLIDCGLSGKNLEKLLALIDVRPSDINAMLITHEHIDHVRGAGVVSRRHNIPIAATQKTHMAMDIGNISDENRILINPYEDFEIGNIGIKAFSIPHDAGDPVGYRIYAPGFSAAVATDLGYFAPAVKDAVEGADVVLLESNHDPEMLRRNPNYPQHLKSRILGRKGHLSNASGAEAAAELVRSGTKHLLLGHLSSENNTPELAYRTVREELEKAGAEIGRDVTLNVAGRYQASHLYRVK